MVCDQNKLPLCISNIEANRIIYNKRKIVKHEIKLLLTLKITLRLI